MLGTFDDLYKLIELHRVSFLIKDFHISPPGSMILYIEHYKIHWWQWKDKKKFDAFQEAVAHQIIVTIIVQYKVVKR